MLSPTRVRIAGFTGLALAALLALPGLVLAGSPGTIAQTGGMSATLPILGASLAVDVTLDSSGNLSQVDLDPVGTYTATKLGSHAVTFDTADGVTQVRIRASGDKLSIKASTTTLASLLGSGTWSSDVFGTHEKSSVAYTIGKAGDGSPTVTIDSVNAATGITATTLPATTKGGKGSASATARVDFARGGFVKHFAIKVSVRTMGSRPASLSITLSGKDRQKLTGTLAELAGDHTWSGALCDGTAVTATINVAADGTVTYVSATGAPATSTAFPGGKVKGHGGFGHEGFGLGDLHRDVHGVKATAVSGVLVRFSGQRTAVVAVVFKLADGTYALAISGLGGHCGGSRNGTPPKVNVPVSPTATHAAPGHHGPHGVRLARFNGRHGRGHGHGH